MREIVASICFIFTSVGTCSRLLTKSFTELRRLLDDKSLTEPRRERLELDLLKFSTISLFLDPNHPNNGIKGLKKEEGKG